MRALAVSIPLLAACTPMEQAPSDEQACRQAAAREASFQAYRYHHRIQPIVVGPGQVVFPSGAYLDPHAEPYLHENRLAQLCNAKK